MGTRRMRDLSQRPGIAIGLYDERADRRKHAAERFGLTAYPTIDEALSWGPDALIISTPPDHHEPYIKLALEQGLHHFCEENIWTYDYKEIERTAKAKGLHCVPSCSYHFLPAVCEVKRIVEEELGGLHAYQMTLSTYMPNWHPEEGDDFYARKRQTAAAREMVPFELVWLNHVFGMPKNAAGSLSKNGALDVPWEDTWCVHMDLETGGHGQLTVVQGCPADCRRGFALGTHGWFSFDMFTGQIERRFSGIGIEDCRDTGGQIQHMELAYKTEINRFIDVLAGRADWPFTYYESSLATGTLAAAELGAVTGRKEAVDPARQPEREPPGAVTVSG